MGGIECVAPTKSKLRFLQTTTATTTATTAKTETTATTTTKVNPESVADVAAFQTVCALPSPVCESDPSGAKTYSEYFAQFTGDLKTDVLFKTNLGIDNVFLAAENSIVTTTDEATPDL